jgi:hypothetical protein
MKNILCGLLILLSSACFAQDTIYNIDTISHKTEEVAEIDAIELFFKLVLPKKNRLKDSAHLKPRKIDIALLPSLSYTLQTGIAAGFMNSYAFYTSKNSNLSSIIFHGTYSQKSQTIFYVQQNVFTKNNSWNLLGDWRYLKYPTPTYGLGGYSKEADVTQLDYSYLRLYEWILKKINNNLYAGAGFCLDYHWNVKELGTPNASLAEYGLPSHKLSSGWAVNVQYDERKNSMNPSNSRYAHIVYRDNSTFLGSDENWQSILIDLRSFTRLPAKSKNVLAFWSYNNLTLSGKPPYLDLPANQWDTYSNTSRGYIQGRFRGPGMIDFETEYRMVLTKNGLLGAVAFANIQSYSDWKTPFKFDKWLPGGGVGLRLKISKISNINVAVDYGFGIDGSRGFFFNLGEVF